MIQDLHPMYPADVISCHTPPILTLLHTHSQPHRTSHSMYFDAPLPSPILGFPPRIAFQHSPSRNILQLLPNSVSFNVISFMKVSSILSTSPPNTSPWELSPYCPPESQINVYPSVYITSSINVEATSNLPCMQKRPACDSINVCVIATQIKIIL